MQNTAAAASILDHDHLLSDYNEESKDANNGHDNNIEHAEDQETANLISPARNMVIDKGHKSEMKTINHQGGGSSEDESGAFGDTGALDLKKQPFSANMNLMSYQTANFGPNGQTKPIGADNTEAVTPAEPNSSSTVKHDVSSPTAG